MKPTSILIIGVALCLQASAALANWPQFRGPSGQGLAPDATPPTEWSEEKNITWKAPLPGRAWSTPVIWENQIWVTNSTADGKTMSAICLDRTTGKRLFEKVLFENEAPEPLGNKVNGYGSCSPAIEAGRVYVHFGSYGTTCLDTKTFEQLWTRRDLPCRHYRGPASSVVLYKDTVILTMDGVDVQYLTALDKKTGESVWRTDRTTEFGDLDKEGKPRQEGDARKAYSTPLFVKVGDATQMISIGAKAAYSYDPDSGKEIWKVTYAGFSNAASAAAGDGLALINTGYGKAQLHAVKLDGAKGDITKTHVAWKQTKRIPQRSSPLVVGNRVYVTSDEGMMSCFDLKSGEEVWSDRLPRSKFSGSPIFAGGNIYCGSELGSTFVVAPGDTLKIIAENKLDDGMMASPVAIGKELYLRTTTHLYRIEEK